MNNGNSNTASVSIKKRLNEVFFMCNLGIAFFVLLALVTYHTSDPSWSTTGSSIHPHNAGGRVGAYVSDVLLFFLGYPAYLFPVLYGAIAIQLLRFSRLDYQPGLWQVLRVIGFCCILCALCGLSEIWITPNIHFIPSTAGGVLGLGIGHTVVTWLNPIGGSVGLTILFFAGMTMLFGMRWIQVSIDQTSTQTKHIFSALSGYLKTLKEKRANNQFEMAQPVITQPQIINKVEQLEIQTPIEKPKKQTVKIKSTPTKTQDFHATPVVTEGLPTTELLDAVTSNQAQTQSTQELQVMSSNVEARLQEFGIAAKVVGVHQGPVVTRFELEPAPGTKASRITTLSKDLARSLSKTSVRVVEVIPGKSVIGLELPNDSRQVVQFKELIQSKQYQAADSRLSLALGKDIAGNPVVVDVARMPHLLVAGTTGSGKSVSVNAMLLSILMKATPEEIRLIMIDPKMLELSVYDGIPHLLAPVVTDMKEAASALRWCVIEMDRRYRLMAKLSVRNLAGYNQKIKDAEKNKQPIMDPFAPEGETPEALTTMPQILVVIDELADLMMVVGKKVEELIARIAQKARAAGIHLIVATQRPSVDVITGLIKANIPARIAFQVSSRIDSRTILDQQGAEHLLGHGDMLYLPPGSSMPIRIHGAFVSDAEVLRVVADWKARGEPRYQTDITEANDDGDSGSITGFSMSGDNEQDPLYDQIVEFVTETRRVSVSLIQRRFKIGFNRAARIVEALEAAGVVSPMQNNGNREVLAPPPPK